MSKSRLGLEMSTFSIEEYKPVPPKRSLSEGILEFCCPHCSTRMGIGARHRGRQIDCPICHLMMGVPLFETEDGEER